MGKNAKRRKERKLAGRPDRSHLRQLPAGVTEAELQTVRLIQAMQDPTLPPCPGPIAVHADGAFECLGGCDGVRTAFHDDDASAPCYHSSIPAVGHMCRRCADVKPLRDAPDAGAPDIAVKASAVPVAACSGIELDHEDGSVTCSLGDACGAPGELHASGMTCSLRPEPCGICQP